MTLTDLTLVRLIVYVALPELDRVTLGEEARVSMNAHPIRFFDGSVIQIAAEALSFLYCVASRKVAEPSVVGYNGLHTAVTLFEVKPSFPGREGGGTM